MTITLDLAVKLKESGFPWEPKVGDWYYFMGNESPSQIIIPYNNVENVRHGTFAPRLDDLLAWIEAQGYGYRQRTTDCPETYPAYRHYIALTKWIDGNSVKVAEFWGKSREDAAAQAVIYILGQQKEAADA